MPNHHDSYKYNNTLSRDLDKLERCDFEMSVIYGQVEEGKGVRNYWWKDENQRY